VGLAVGASQRLQRVLGSAACAIALTACLGTALVLESRAAQSPANAMVPSVPAARQTVLTNISQIVGLKNTQAKQGLPVRLTGVVTYFDAEWNLLFICDGTGSIYVAPTPGMAKAQSGDLVEMEGITAPGGNVPIVARAALQVLGRGQMPEPSKASPKELVSGQAGSQWVEVRGIVRAADDREGRLGFDLQIERERIRGYVLDYAPSNVTQMADAEIKFQGVCANSYDDKGRFAGVQLFVPGMANIQVEQPAPADPFALPLRAVSELPRLSPEHVRHRVRVQGTVLQQKLGQHVTLKEPTGTIQCTPGK